MNKNIYTLPTDKPSKKGDIVVWNGLKIWNGIGKPPHHNQNIYITNDEEIKEGDYYIDFTSDGLKIEHFKTKDDWVLVGICDSKKIILTDNKDLIKDGVQAIDDEFLEWFVAHPSCESVEVESMINMVQFTPREFIYKIIIPKEEPKQETHLTWWKSLSTWYLKTKMMKKYGYDSKLVAEDIDLHPDDIKYIWEKEIKQETLEEVAKKQWGNVHRTGVLGFIEGAKWQAERMYSEEEVRLMLSESFKASQEGYDITSDSIIEQFKKK
jgi:hypothetical protein